MFFCIHFPLCNSIFSCILHFHVYQTFNYPQRDGLEWQNCHYLYSRSYDFVLPVQLPSLQKPRQGDKGEIQELQSQQMVQTLDAFSAYFLVVPFTIYRNGAYRVCLTTGVFVRRLAYQKTMHYLCQQNIIQNYSFIKITQWPALVLPSRSKTPFFCMAERSRLTVFTTTDKTRDISLADT